MARAVNTIPIEETSIYFNIGRFLGSKFSSLGANQTLAASGSQLDNEGCDAPLNCPRLLFLINITFIMLLPIYHLQTPH